MLREYKKLLKHRRLSACPKCGGAVIIIHEEIIGSSDGRKRHFYEIGCCELAIDRKSVNGVVNAWNKLTAPPMQDEERTWFDVDLVYETRWDCMAAPGGARKAA